MKWEDVLAKECGKAFRFGGEVRIVFIKRKEEVTPIVYPSSPAPISCEIERVVED